jgi:hypothetical protein
MKRGFLFILVVLCAVFLTAQACSNVNLYQSNNDLIFMCEYSSQVICDPSTYEALECETGAAFGSFEVIASVGEFDCSTGVPIPLTPEVIPDAACLGLGTADICVVVTPGDDYLVSCDANAVVAQESCIETQGVGAFCNSQLLSCAACTSTSTLDTDGDGLINDCDDDDDNDGIVDIDDQCPLLDPNDADGDGTIDCQEPSATDGNNVCEPATDILDTDGDSVVDDCDDCPLDDPNDTDGDGVCDSDDVCSGDDTVDTDLDSVCDADDPCPIDATDACLLTGGICDSVNMVVLSYDLDGDGDVDFVEWDLDGNWILDDVPFECLDWDVDGDVDDDDLAFIALPDLVADVYLQEIENVDLNLPTCGTDGDGDGFPDIAYIGSGSYDGYTGTPTVTYVVVVRNDDNSYASNSVTDSFDVTLSISDVDSTICTHIVTLADLPEVNSDVGHQFECTFDLTTELDPLLYNAAADYDLELEVDSNNVIAEDDEDNNDDVSALVSPLNLGMNTLFANIYPQYCDDLGTPTSFDNCGGLLLIPNPSQVDTDGDHMGDICDLCPNDFDPLRLDTDYDLIGDVCDTCPEDATNSC